MAMAKTGREGDLSATISDKDKDKTTPDNVKYANARKREDTNADTIRKSTIQQQTPRS